MEELIQKLLEENNCSTLEELQNLISDDSYAYRVAKVVIKYLISSSK